MACSHRETLFNILRVGFLDPQATTGTFAFSQFKNGPLNPLQVHICLPGHGLIRRSCCRPGFYITQMWECFGLVDEAKRMKETIRAGRLLVIMLDGARLDTLTGIMILVDLGPYTINTYLMPRSLVLSLDETTLCPRSSPETLPTMLGALTLLFVIQIEQLPQA